MQRKDYYIISRVDEEYQMHQNVVDEVQSVMTRLSHGLNAIFSFSRNFSLMMKYLKNHNNAYFKHSAIFNLTEIWTQAFFSPLIPN